MKNQLINLMKIISQTTIWQIFIKGPLSVKKGWTGALNVLTYFIFYFFVFLCAPIYLDDMNNPIPKSIEEMRTDTGVLIEVKLAKSSNGSFKIKTKTGQELEYEYYMHRSFEINLGYELKVSSQETTNMFGFKRHSLRAFQIIRTFDNKLLKKFDYEFKQSRVNSDKKIFNFFLQLTIILLLRLFIKYRK